MNTPPLTRPLTALRDGDRPSAGGKATGLGELIAAGLPVPAGFAVTTAAFGQAVRAVDPSGTLRQQIGRLPAENATAIAEATAGLRARILAEPLPAAVRDEVAARYQALAGPGPDVAAAAVAGPGPDVAAAPVAVRSSATGEDSAAASFAGLQDTYLWVTGQQAVADRVRRCWASLYSVESVTYRRHQGVPEDGLAMAVVVQRMVEPRCAGVMFTRSPVTGDTSVVVLEASWGLGSALVSGDVTPDRYVVSKVTGEIVSRVVASKLRHHQRDPAGPGVCLRDVPPALRDVPCLDDAEIRALAGLGRTVAGHFGAPQDIEWAIDASGRIMLLQSRPETVWSGRERGPSAAPAARPFDHVLRQLGKPNNLAAL
ncbi:MAG TPA: PEP/pyruvate-binding domain-containing protein [Streptosporangiaceae bacterium]